MFTSREDACFVTEVAAEGGVCGAWKDGFLIFMRVFLLSKGRWVHMKKHEDKAMDAKSLLEEKTERIYPKLAEYILADPKEGGALIEELLESDRYRDDFEFRAAADTARALLILISGDFKTATSFIPELIERVASLGLWQLEIVNWNHLGNVFMSLQNSEKALECYFHVVNIEERHGQNLITAIAYYNISILFCQVDAFEKTLHYLERAIEKLDESTKGAKDYDSKLMLILSFYLQNLCRVGQLDKAREIHERMRALPTGEGVSKESLFSARAAEMYYAFYTTDRSGCKDVYRKVREMIDDRDVVRRYLLIHAYTELCQEFEMSADSCGEQILELESLPEAPSPKIMEVTYRYLRRYYEMIGDSKGYERANAKYQVYIEQELKEIQSQQLHTLETVEALVFGSKHGEELSSKNVELKMLADEAFKNKNELEKTYRKLEVITAIGKKLTSSVQLSEVVDLIFETLQSMIPIDAFLLMVADASRTKLRSVAVYYSEKLQREVTIDVDDEQSAIARCYRTGEVMVLDHHPSEYARRMVGKGIEKMNSSIFMPLRLGDEIIGVSTVQCEQSAAYGRDQIAFLEDLQPYLAIALNNALHIWRLEEEIQSGTRTQQMLEKEIERHKRTQSDLQKAYNSLEVTSSLDSLTQISSRRDFEFKFLDLLKKSYEADRTVSVFMMDIDSFKLYNDNYGHFEGDEVLKQVATVFRKRLDAAGGLSARFGGEEFIGACSGLDVEQSQSLAERICRDVYDLNIAHKMTHLGRITVSIGVSTARRVGEKRKSDIMRLADVSLYAAKNAGKNRVILKQLNQE